jgi:hypothetical protein
MEIGEEEPAKVVEPVQDPFEQPEPLKAPAPVRAPEPVKTPEREPAKT